MRIVEIIPELIQAGAERFVVDLCNQLVKKHEICLISLYPIDKSQPFVGEIDKRIELYTVNKRKGFDLAALIRLNRLINRLKPDVVHSHLYALTYLFPSFMTNNSVCFMHTIHSHAAREAGRGVKRWLRKFAFSRHKVFPVAISEESQNSFYSFYGLDSKLIYNGRPATRIDKELQLLAKKEIEDLRVSADSIVLVNVARIVDVKNQVALAEAIDSLSKSGWNVDLFIIGDAHDSMIEQKIVSLNNPRVHLLGVKKDPRSYMEFADAFILPSKMEGMPITLIEAFSMGIIPICTAVGGVINMIQDGVNGILIKSPQKQDIIDALIRFFKLLPEEKNRMAIESYKSYSKYDIADSASNYESYMKELINK